MRCCLGSRPVIDQVRTFHGALLLLLATGCAQVGSPDGGGRDEAAPTVVWAEPAFGTVGFDATDFTLAFDEFVQLQDARRQILVSPPLGEPPRALVRGRSVRVDLGGDLLPDRTYIVQFGDAVRDLREGNVAKGLTYVFSTGSQLDSGRVAGRAVDAWTAEAMAGSRVCLFRDGLPEGILDAGRPDSLRAVPDYVGLVDDSGRFEVRFLPEGRFGILVVQDANGNYRADAGEAVGWWEEPFRASADSASWAGMALRAPARMDTPPPIPATYTSGIRVDSSGYLTGAVMGLGELRAGPKGWDDAAFGLVLEGPEGPVDLWLEGDSIRAILPGFPEALQGPWTLTHPSGTDTLRGLDPEALRPPAPVGRCDRNVPPMGFSTWRFAPHPTALDSSLCGGIVILNGDTSALDPALFSLEGGIVTLGPLAAGSRIDARLLPGAVSGPGGSLEDTTLWQVEVRLPEEEGIIHLIRDTLHTGDHDLWVLLDGQGMPLYGYVLDTQGKFTGLTPGKYGLALISDLDSNGRWTGADPASGLMPEPVLRWSDPIDVRAGWEVEVTP